MRRLQDRDGTTRHLRHARYHISFCTHRQNDALFVQLSKDMDSKHDATLQSARNTENAEDQLTAAIANASFAELTLEDFVRDVESDLGKLDRQDPGLNLVAQVFPEGLGGVINPENEAQLPVIVAFHKRLEGFSKHPEVPHMLAKLEQATSGFEAALAAKKQAESALIERQVEEQQAKKGIREQFESAYGQLRDRFKSRPKFAERYFYQERTSEKPQTNPDTDPNGRAKGKAEAILRILDARKLEPSAKEIATITTATDHAALDRWIDRALTATKVEELFA